jgi:predicted ATPase/DNA-binding SARP family transcriptional activator
MENWQAGGLAGLVATLPLFHPSNPPHLRSSIFLFGSYMAIIYRLRLLGNIQVEKEGTLIRDFESRKSLALLGYLAQQAEPVSRSLLAGLFWGDKEEARGRRNLSRELSQLSARIPGCFQSDYYTVQFQPLPGVWVDTIAFEELIKSRGAGVKPAPLLLRSPAQLAEAVALYRGQFMAGFYLDDCPEFETWLLSEQEAWQRRVTAILDQLITYHTRRHQDDQALGYARRWLALEPWQEQAHRALMLLLAHSGQRGAALTQYETCRRVLAEELAAEPSKETVELYEQIRAGQLPPRVAPEPIDLGEAAPGQPTQAEPVALTPPPPPVNIPLPGTAMINRDDERAAIAARLADPACRLLTLIGPGGIGKTRLAIQAGLEAATRSVGGELEHGIYFIPLDPLSSADFLLSTLANAINFSFYSGDDPTSQLLNYLREKRMLLILDNFEHLLTADQTGGVDLVANILAHAGHVKILAASRERLNLQGEWILPVQGLSAPAPHDRVTTKELAGYSAVQLFLQQAQTVQPGFKPTTADQQAIQRICRLVEGVPLAIELAASWLQLLSCDEIAAEIERNLDFLATPLRNVPERHRSLRAVFDYSWQLMSPEEKRIFRQLSVFRGGFRHEAAEQVAGASLAHLRTLVNKSLLQPPQAGRYLRHMLLWQYATEKLAELPAEQGSAQERHGLYYAGFLAQRSAALQGGDQKQALTEIGEEIENIRLSWRWAIAHGHVAALEQSLESLFHFYDMRSWFKEGAEVFALAAESLAIEAREEENRQLSIVNRQSAIANRQSQIVLGKLLARQGWYTFQLGRHQQAEELLQQALILLRPTHIEGEPKQAAPVSALIFPLNYLGAVHRYLGEYDLAQQYLLESKLICQQVADQAGLSIALNILAQIANLQGDYSQARQLGRESLKIKRSIGDYWGMAFSLNILGQIAYTLEDYGEAKALFQESLAICQAIDDRRGTGLCLNYLGDVVGKMGDVRGAQQLYGESLATFREIGNQLGIISTHIKLGYSTGELGDYATARGYFHQALQMGLEIQALPAVLDALVGEAMLIMRGGQGKTAQVVEILALAFSHPASSRDNQDRAARLLDELASQLPPEAVKVAQAKVQASSLNALAQQIMSNG